MKVNPSFWLSLFFLVLFSAAVFTAMNWSWDTKLFPYAIGIPGILLALWQLILDLTDGQRFGDNDRGSKPQIMDITTDLNLSKDAVRRGTFLAIGWILCLVFAIWFVGFLLAAPLFVFFYIRYQAKTTIRFSATIACLLAIFIWGVFDQIIHVVWPDAMLFRLLGF